MAVKVCGRCRKKFECNANEISKCECTEIILNPATLEFLQKTTYDCICNQCLIDIDQLVIEAVKSDLPRSMNQFIENHHYTIENGLYVFSEFYLIQRGYCCENRCRNCPYGLRPK